MTFNRAVACLAVMLLSVVFVQAQEQMPESPWVISFTAGLSFNSGNTESSQLNGGFRVVRKEYPVDLAFTGDMLYGQSSGVRNADRGKLTFNYDRYILLGWEAFFIGSAEYDRIAHIDSRNGLGAGVKREFIKSKRGEISISGAVLSELEKDTNGVETQSERLSIRPKVKIHVSETADLNIVAFYIPNINNADDYRTEATLEFKTMISRNLWFKCMVYDRFDSVVDAGVKNNDLTLISAVESKF